MIGMGQLDPSAVIPGFVTPTPQNPFGLPGLGGAPSIPNILDPGGQTDPNRPRVDPLPGGGVGPTPPAQAAAGVPMLTVAIAAAAALAIGFLVARATA